MARNPIQLTDRFIIDRLTPEGYVTMTIDGHDFKEFTLDLQSEFTTEVEARVILLENQAFALETDLYFFINNVEPNHEAELDERLLQLNLDVQKNATAISITEQLAEDIRQSTRIIGKYFLIDGKSVRNLLPGEMKINYKDPTDGGRKDRFRNTYEIFFHETDLLAMDSGIDEKKKFENIFPGDILELSSSNSAGLLFRAVYEIDEVLYQDNLTTDDEYGKLKYARLRLRDPKFVLSSGDADGTPTQNDQEQTNPNRIDTRVEIFPSIPTESFAQKDEYVTMANAAYPIGIVMAWFTNDIPHGWLKCDGTAVPNEPKYTTLRDTYRMTVTPDMRGRALIGTGAFGLTTVNMPVDQTTSRPSNEVKSTQAGAHTHVATLSSAGSHSHKYGDSSKTGGGTNSTASSAQNGGSFKTSTAGNHSHTITLNDNGGHTHTIEGWDTYNRMYSRTCHYIIKAFHVD